MDMATPRSGGPPRGGSRAHPNLVRDQSPGMVAVCPEGTAHTTSGPRSPLCSISTPLLNPWTERTAIVAELPVTGAMPAGTPLPARNGRAPAPSAAAPSHRATVPKRSAREAWDAWRATGSEADGIVFCERVLPWLEGTSAQLSRPVWPNGGVRPTAAVIQARLREALGLVLAHEPDYIEALDIARRRILQQLRSERARDASR